MPIFALSIPMDLHLLVQQAQQTQVLEPQAVTPQVLTPSNPNITAAKTSQKYKTFFQGYFDAGVSDLIGSFSTQVLRYGVRSGQHDLHVYGRNETLDTTKSKLPFRSVVQGTSAGLGYRYWLPGNLMFATVQFGYIFSGFNKKKQDLRVGLAGYVDSKSEKWFSDFYGDFFYIDLAKDTFLSARSRGGLILNRNRDGILSTYLVGQVFASGKGANGSENRLEGGFGIGYAYRGVVSANVELRAGYSFQGTIKDRSYLNPQFVISGGF